MFTSKLLVSEDEIPRIDEYVMKQAEMHLTNSPPINGEVTLKIENAQGQIYREIYLNVLSDAYLNFKKGLLGMGFCERENCSEVYYPKYPPAFDMS